ncbi:alcohol dehydrogenase catalytic domain-containing protein [Nocardia sp. NPDC052278]|uniref:alcohol dehydrogenase catalytic domain-containing protein n=1 Tax=unclassified Nocardia TaxID=2637762 RepID=UPI0036C079E2
MTMITAYRLIAPGRAELTEIPKPVPGPGEVLLRVGAYGICHSDVSLVEAPGQLPHVTLPLTIGHETTAWIEALGPGVQGWSEAPRHP